jgi:FkbM family methyltransferase
MDWRPWLNRRRFSAAVRPAASGTELERLGDDACGWVVPVRLVHEDWVCYTVGVGENATFDQALADIGCEVVAIDPTPRSIEHLAPLVGSNPRLRLLPYALWTEDRDVHFYAPADPAHVSHSITNLQGTTETITVPGRRLETIAAELGHEQIDLLKLDIEGAEYDVLRSIDLQALGVKVLCVEYHHDRDLGRMLEAVRDVERRGFRPVHVRGTDVTFVSDRLSP